MNLPVNPPVRPMLAKLARSLPEPAGLLYEPKWDGFRCIAFRDGDEVELGSRNERPLNRYFPEVVDGVRAELPPRCVVDGEIVVVGPAGLDFDALQLRIHPAASRIEKLARELPAWFVAFDLLALGDEDLRGRPLAERRPLLDAALAGVGPPVQLSPATQDRDVAADWFERFEGAGLDGVVAKRLDGAYRENERVMLKIKHERTADCVVAGFRWHKVGGVVGSLLLGVYDAEGVLHHLGVTASFTMSRRRELVEEIAPYREGAAEGHPWAWGDAGAAAAAEGAATRMPGGTSRWSGGRDTSWEPLRPELVAEVSYDHLQGDRFRHATTFKRWREDRDPRSCTYAQFEVAVAEEVAAVFRG